MSAGSLYGCLRTIGAPRFRSTKTNTPQRTCSTSSKYACVGQMVSTSWQKWSSGSTAAHDIWLECTAWSIRWRCGNSGRTTSEIASSRCWVVCLLATCRVSTGWPPDLTRPSWCHPLPTRTPWSCWKPWQRRWMAFPEPWCSSNCSPTRCHLGWQQSCVSGRSGRFAQWASSRSCGWPDDGRR